MLQSGQKLRHPAGHCGHAKARCGSRGRETGSTDTHSSGRKGYTGPAVSAGWTQSHMQRATRSSPEPDGWGRMLVHGP